MKHLKQYEQYISVNDVLDKINNQGIDSLNKKELDILNNNSGDNIEDDNIEDDNIEDDNNLYHTILNFIQELNQNINNPTYNKFEAMKKASHIKKEILKDFDVVNPHDLPDNIETLYYKIVDTMHAFMMK